MNNVVCVSKCERHQLPQTKLQKMAAPYLCCAAAWCLFQLHSTITHQRIKHPCHQLWTPRSSATNDRTIGHLAVCTSPNATFDVTFAANAQHGGNTRSVRVTARLKSHIHVADDLKGVTDGDCFPERPRPCPDVWGVLLASREGTRIGKTTHGPQI